MSAPVVQGAAHAGGVWYVGEQREIFRTGRAGASLALADLQGIPDLYALGPVEGLDGEITVFNSMAYVSKLRGAGDAYAVDCTFNHNAIFLVWAQVREWDDVPVPNAVSNYGELETFVAET